MLRLQKASGWTNTLKEAQRADCAQQEAVEAKREVTEAKREAEAALKEVERLKRLLKENR